jgi:hypothetical protein
VKDFQPQPHVVVAPGPAGDELYSERYHLVAELLTRTNMGAEIELKLRRYREPENLLSYGPLARQTTLRPPAGRESVYLMPVASLIDIYFGCWCRCVSDWIRAT